MEQILSLCGMRCDLCMAYRPNLEKQPENQQILSDGWFKYFGFRIPPEDINCVGCFPDGNPTLDSGCEVKTCVTDQKLENCAGCKDYICDKLSDRLVTFEAIQEKFDQQIPEIDRQRFIFPYENAARLAKVRNKK